MMRGDKRNTGRFGVVPPTENAFNGPTTMTRSILYLSKMVSSGDRLNALLASEWLSFGAAPTFAFMAALTGILGGGAHEMLCSPSHASALTGMVPMYVLMSAFHLGPWLKLISGWRSGDELGRSCTSGPHAAADLGTTARKRRLIVRRWAERTLNLCSKGEKDE
jgi:hypothetical protein